MITYRPIHLVAITLLFGGCGVFYPPQSEIAPLTILHWNDFHARNIPYEVTSTDTLTGTTRTYNVGGTANFTGYLNAYGRGTEGVAVVNAGDDFQGTPISSLTRGRSQIELMNIISPDVMVLGNHEFDYGLDDLRENIRKANFPILASNLFDSSTATTFAPSILVKSIGKVKVGFIGLLPPDLPVLVLRSSLVGTSMLDLDSIVSFQINRLKRIEKVDIILVVSHMGFAADTMLAGRHPQIDVIIGGHSHKALFRPIKKNRTIVCQAEKWGRYVGKLDLMVELRGDSVVSYAGRLIETELGIHPIDLRADSVSLAFESQVDKELNEEIGTLEVEWKTSFTSECNIGNWEADVMRDFAGTDIAFMNSGGLRKGLRPGPITKRDMWEINPFGNTFVTFTVTGRMLMDMLDWQAAGKGELMQVSGLRYAFDRSKPDGQKVKRAWVGGRDIVPDSTYSIVTNNYVAGHIPKLLGTQEPVTMEELNVVDRDVMIQYVQKQQVIRSEVEGRIVSSQHGGSER